MHSFTTVFLVVCIGALVLNRADGQCIQKFPGVNFAGNTIALKSKIDSADQCTSACSAQSGCKSADYHATEKRCYLRDQLLNTNDAHSVKVWAKEDPNVTYITVACGENGKPMPPPVFPTPGKPIAAGSCGRAGFDIRSNLRIVGGFEARKNSFPWIVSMSRMLGIHFCGATLIRVNPKVEESDIFITASHCVEDSSRNITALFGAHDASRKEDGTEAIPVEKIVTHPKYRMKAFNDIAILKLVRPVKFGPIIQPVCLPAAGERPADGSTVIVSGWGRNSENGSSSNLLHQVSLPVMNPQECVDTFKKNGWPVVLDPQIMLCAGYPEGGMDSCQGDSGGPLIAKGPNGYVLQGVVSFGKGCARSGWPGVYTRVSSYIDWINETVKALSAVASG